MNMDQNMDQMMARMHEQNYKYDMQLAQHFQGISNTFSEMAKSEYQMYLHHSGQNQNMMQQHMPGKMTQPLKAGMTTSPMTSSMMSGM